MNIKYSKQYFSESQFLFYTWFEAMYTRVDLAICASSGGIDMVELASEIENEILKYENIGNRFSAESELSFVNKHAFQNEVTVSPELCKMLGDCQYFNRETGGYFDITVGSLDRHQENSETFEVNGMKNTVRFLVSGLQLDLSGFLKGYVVGKIGHILQAKGIGNALINMGNSSILAKGNHPFGKGWKIKTPETGYECTLMNECLTTSGNNESTQWPVMNPKNGEIPKNKRSVSVITTDPAVGEVLSTAAYLAGESELGEIMNHLNGRILNELKQSTK